MFGSFILIYARSGGAGTQGLGGGSSRGVQRSTSVKLGAFNQLFMYFILNLALYFTLIVH
jgi:hypothetical protein